MTRPDWYKILGVPRDASDADIRQGRRRLAKAVHPDVNAAAGAANDMAAINAACEVLLDRKRRAQYDRELVAAERRVQLRERAKNASEMASQARVPPVAKPPRASNPAPRTSTRSAQTRASSGSGWGWLFVALAAGAAAGAYATSNSRDAQGKFHDRRTGHYRSGRWG